MKIKEVHPDGIGYAAGLKTGDEILSINGNPIRDVIDYHFNLADRYIDIVVKRDGELISIGFEFDENRDLNVDFEDMKLKRCGCKCVFCFVDQNPPGLRKTLYFRDEDFRLSFMHGSYFTLSNTKRADLERIVEQRLSPLYISVHAFDPDVRKFLFGIKRDDNLIDKIRFLADNRIELHTQIVICPGINDGGALDETISGLEAFYPNVRSAALVPVGLTKFRGGLTKIEPVTPDYAGKLITKIHRIQKKYLEKQNERFVYLADEWYHTAGRRLPGISHYGGLFQLENGVGLTRQFIQEVKRQKNVFKMPLKKRGKIHILTGTMAAPILREHLVPVIEQAGNIIVEVTGIENRFYGSSVHVSGLLSGGDFLRIIEKDEGGLFLLPPNCLNTDGLTLDDYTIESMAEKSGKQIFQYAGSLEEIRKQIEAA